MIAYDLNRRIVHKSPWTVHGRCDRSTWLPWTVQHPSVYGGLRQALGLGARMHASSSGPAAPLPASVALCTMPLVSSLFRVYLRRLDSVWAVLELIGFCSSSWTSLWAQYESNFEVLNLNNLHFDSIFDLHLSLRGCHPSHPHTLGHACSLMDG